MRNANLSQSLSPALQAWANSRGGLQALSKAKPERIASELQITIAEVLSAQQTILAQIGDQTQGLRDAGANRNLSAGGIPFSSTAASAYAQGGYGDTELIMRTLKRKVGHRPLEALEQFRSSKYSEADAKATIKAFGLRSLAEAKAFIGQHMIDGTEQVLSDKGITQDTWDDHDLRAAFDKSGYSQSDVDAALKAFDFLSNVEDAKEYIGLKIVNGLEEILEEVGISRYQFDSHEMLDAFRTSGYSLADAQKALDTFGFLTTLKEAKEYIGLKVVNDYEEMLADVGITPLPFDRHDQLDAFQRSSYTADDAQKAMEHFSFLSTIEQAKSYIGLKVINGTEDILKDAGINAAGGQLDAHVLRFRQSAYSDLDAQAVQAALGLGSLKEAKAFIGEKLAAGEESQLQSLGVSPYDFDDHELMHAFAKSGYTEADAQAALDTFGFLSTLDDAKEYIGLKIVNGYEQMLSDAGITREPFDRHDMMSAFRTSNYSLADAEAAVQKFDFLNNVQQAMEYIGLKVINGWEDMLHDVGISPDNHDRHELLAEFAASGLKTSDAKRVMNNFSFLRSINDAKAYIGLQLLEGNDRLLAGALG